MAKTGRKWSPKEKAVIKRFMKDAKDRGQHERRGMEEAAKHFGVSTNAIYCCMRRDYSKKKVKARSAVEAGKPKKVKYKPSVKHKAPAAEVRSTIMTVSGPVKSVEIYGNVVKISY